jgi:hypothetical protein
MKLSTQKFLISTEKSNYVVQNLSNNHSIKYSNGNLNSNFPAVLVRILSLVTSRQRQQRTGDPHGHHQGVLWLQLRVSSRVVGRGTGRVECGKRWWVHTWVPLLPIALSSPSHTHAKLSSRASHPLWAGDSIVYLPGPRCRGNTALTSRTAGASLFVPSSSS